MSRKAMRQGVAAYFAVPAIPGLNRVYTAKPRRVPASAFKARAPGGSGAVGYPFVEGQDETRIGIGGAHSGWKQVTYDVVLVVRFLSYGSGEQAEDAHDDIIDGIVAHLRADRTLGGAAWSAGEGSDQRGGSDIRVHSGEALQRRVGGPIVIWSYVEFTAIEDLGGT